MKKYFEILAKCPLFDGIEPNDLNTMIGCLHVLLVLFSSALFRLFGRIIMEIEV